LVLSERLSDLVNDLIMDLPQDPSSVLGKSTRLELRHSICQTLCNVICASRLNGHKIASNKRRLNGTLKRAKNRLVEQSSIYLFVDDVECHLRDLYGNIGRESLDDTLLAVRTIIVAIAEYANRDLWKEYNSVLNYDLCSGFGIPEDPISQSDIATGEAILSDLVKRSRTVLENRSNFSRYTVGFAMYCARHSSDEFRKYSNDGLSDFSFLRWFLGGKEFAQRGTRRIENGEVANLAMPRGSKPGERRGGRQRGTPNKATVAKNAALEAACGNPTVTPLQFLLEIMRDSNVPTALRVQVARAAAPLVHAKPETSTARSTGKAAAFIDTEGLAVDLEEARALRDTQHRLAAFMRKLYGPRENGGPLTATEIAEEVVLSALLSKTVESLVCPPGYGPSNAMKDADRLHQLHCIRLSPPSCGGGDLKAPKTRRRRS
jgi:hypothetical protein